MSEYPILTKHELAIAEPEACPVERVDPTYWRGSASQWRIRALRAEAQIAEMHAALIAMLEEVRGRS